MAGISADANGAKRGFAATYCRDPFGNVFEIIEIHEDETMMRV